MPDQQAEEPMLVQQLSGRRMTGAFAATRMDVVGVGCM
jgi:hypothetical protein